MTQSSDAHRCPTLNWCKNCSKHSYSSGLFPYLGPRGQLALALWVLRRADPVNFGGQQRHWDRRGGGGGRGWSCGRSHCLGQVWREVVFVTAVTKSTWSSAHYNNKQAVGSGGRWGGLGQLGWGLGVSPDVYQMSSLQEPIYRLLAKANLGWIFCHLPRDEKQILI